MKLSLLKAFILLVTVNFVAAVKYVETWATSPYVRGTLPQGLKSIKNTSIRQTIRISLGGQQFRFKFSNRYGKSELELGEVHVAKAIKNGVKNIGKIDIKTDTPITFNGKKSVVIPAGKEIFSDTINFNAPALTELSVSIYFGNKIPAVRTDHNPSRSTSFFEIGNSVAKESFSQNLKNTQFISLIAIDVVSNDPNSKTIVCLGDSITDGKDSTDDANRRYPDYLAQRLQSNPATRHLAIANQGIGATSVSGGYDNPEYPTGQYRLKLDVLGHSNVKYVVMLYGVNDLIYGNPTTSSLINVYKLIIKDAHNAGLKIIGATILPCAKALDSVANKAAKERIREEVNQWIRTTPKSQGGFDGFIDFDKLMGDPSDKKSLNRKYNNFDGLHPNDLGYQTMANFIDLSLFDPIETPVVKTTTTTTTKKSTVVKTTTTTKKVTTTKQSASTNDTSKCAGLWMQCGGKNYSGPTCCKEGHCVIMNDYYHQCVPANKKY